MRVRALGRGGRPPVALPAALLALLLLLPILSACFAAHRPPAASQRTAIPACSTPAPQQSAPVEGSSAPAAWPEAQHDPRHSSATSATGPQSGKLKWARQLGGAVIPGPVVGPDGTIYAASTAGVLHALDPATGADRWTFDGGAQYSQRDPSTAAAALDGGTILWPGPRNTLYALDSSGHLLWSKAFDSFLLSPAVDIDGTVYLMEANGHLHALAIAPSGARELWVSDLGTTGRSSGSPAIGDDGTIYATLGNRIVAVENDGGQAKILWHFDIASGTEVSPAVGGNGIAVFGTNDNFEYGLDSAGHVLWRYPRNSLSFSSPAVTDSGLAYFGDHNGFMNVVDSHTGCLVIRYQGGGEVWTAPAIDGQGRVYFGTKTGHVLGFEFGGRLLFDFATGAIVASYPALAPDGTLLIGSANGMLYAFHD